DVRRLHLVERDDAEARVLGVGRVGQRDRERTDAARHEALPSVSVGDTIGELAALARIPLVDLPGQILQELVLDDLLIEGRVLAAAVLARIVDEELALGDGGRAERVRLDDVGAGLEEAAMDVTDHLRLGETEEIAVVQQVLARVLEARAADVGFLHAVRPDGRPHRAVDDGDPAVEQLYQGVVLVGVVIAHDLGLPLAGVSLSAMASTTCRCGFFSSRAATWADTTDRP